MQFRIAIAGLALTLLAVAAWADATKDGPRTGYFRKNMTTAELLGTDGAKSVANVLEPDEKLEWQFYVPHSYDASRPAGVLVFISHKGNWGGSRKSYNDLLEEKNLIWAGVLGAGDVTPLNVRMMKSLMTPTVLSRDYALDPNRIYVGGFSGGAHVATLLSTGKPGLFKGGMFVGGAIFWGDKIPPEVDVIRQNRYVFIAGSNDVALKTVRRTAGSYKGAGVVNTKLIIMPNEKQEMPGPLYLREAVEHLDQRGNVAESAE